MPQNLERWNKCKPANVSIRKLASARRSYLLSRGLRSRRRSGGCSLNKVHKLKINRVRGQEFFWPAWLRKCSMCGIKVNLNSSGGYFPRGRFASDFPVEHEVLKLRVRFFFFFIKLTIVIWCTWLWSPEDCPQSLCITASFPPTLYDKTKCRSEFTLHYPR